MFFVQAVLMGLITFDTNRAKALLNGDCIPEWEGRGDRVGIVCVQICYFVCNLL